jgi:hypothetical protein
MSIGFAEEQLWDINPGTRKIPERLQPDAVPFAGGP